jgi:hypothetical protein
VPELADVFRLYGEEYLRKFGDRMLPSHHRAFQDIQNCRTATLGGHVFRCNRCGREEYAYHSCRNRACPKCHTKDTRTWLKARRREILPVAYYHLVFTLPGSLRDLVRRHRNVVYPLLMKAAAHSLIQLARDSRYVGGLTGLLAVLHTWSRTLVYHPHVHCLVPAGGLSEDRDHWLPARHNFLVPVRALSDLFRGKLLRMVKAKFPDVAIPEDLWQQKWVVHCKATVQGVDRILDYLARYVHRIAITNRRIVSVANGTVAFRYQPSNRVGMRTMTLSAEEFIRRFLQHVLPKGAHKVRYYGLWAPSNRASLHRIRTALTLDAAASPALVSPPDAPMAPSDRLPHPRARRCPHCQTGYLLPVERIPPRRKIPP